MIKLRKVRWAEQVAYMGIGEVYTAFLVEKPEEKRPFGRSIKMDLQEVEFGGMDWIDLA